MSFHPGLAPLAGVLLLSSLTAQAAWEVPMPVQSPPARFGTALTNGPNGDLVLFGGDGGQGPLGDTWAWDGSNWSPVLSLHSPPPSSFHAMAFDEHRRCVVLFGGSGAADTWEYDGADWQHRTTATTPPLRSGHAMAYDSARRRVVMFGGRDGSGCLDDTWEYDGADWSAVPTPWHPSARSALALAFDPRTQRTVLFGGRNSNDSLTYDTWQWDGTNWSLAWVYTNLPAPRCGHALAFHPLRYRIVLFGDNNGIGTTHEWDGAQWWPAAGSVPPAQRTVDLGLAWHAASERVVAFGGRSPGTGVPSQLTQQFYSVNPARFAAFGGGCAGTAGMPELALGPWSLPWAGDYLECRIGNVPVGSPTVLVFGTRNDSWGTTPLPLDLSSVGAPGCTAYVRPVCMMYVGSAGIVNYRVFVPWRLNLTGLRFYQQAFLLNSGANNLLGLAASNATAGVVGWR